MGTPRIQKFLTILLAVCVAAFAMAGPAHANEESGTVEVTLTPSELEVGSRFTLTFSLPGEASYEDITVDIPQDQAHLWRLGEPERVRDGVFIVPGRALLRGEHVIGPFDLAVSAADGGTEISYSAAAAEVEVAAPDGEFTGELRDLTAPLEVPFDYFWRNVVLGASALLGLAVLLALVYLLWRTLKRKAAEVIVPVPPDPIEQALTDIRTLKSGEFLRQHGVERFYTRLSTVLRRYMEREFKRPVLEMSDDETVDLLADKFGWLQHASDLGGVMRRSSMAKFARQDTGEKDAMKDCGTVEQFLVAEEYRKKSLELTERAVRRVREQSGEGRAA